MPPRGAKHHARTQDRRQRADYWMFYTARTYRNATFEFLLFGFGCDSLRRFSRVTFSVFGIVKLAGVQS